MMCKKECNRNIAYNCIYDYLKRKFDRPFDECELKATLGRECKISREHCYEVIKVLVELELIKISGKINWRVAYVVN